MAGDSESMQEMPLRQIIDEAGRIPAEQALDIAARAARAIDVIHENGNVHGSIRADTVLIGPHGTVSVDESALSAEVTTTTTHELDAATTDVVAYFSPEQARGLEIDHRSDIYSLGVVLFEMLTGSYPFQAPSPVAVAYEHATVPPPRVDEAHPDIPTQVADIVDRALAKDPDDRYQSAAEMSNALAGAHGEMGLAALASGLSPAAKGQSASVAPARPRWPRVAMASLVMLLAAVSAAGILPMFPASERSPGDPSAVGAESEDQEGTADEFAEDRAGRVGARSGETVPGETATPPSTSVTGSSSPTTSPSATTTTIITATTTTIAPTVTTQPTGTTTEPTTTTAPTTTSTAPTTSTSETTIVTTTQPTTTTTTTSTTTTTTVPTTSSTEPQP